MKNSILVCFYICTLNVGCNFISGSQHEFDLKEFISKYDSADFSFFTDVSISIRSSNASQVIYIVQKYSGNIPVYFITYNLLNNSITEINNEQLKEANVNDYFTNEQIVTYINEFRKYDFYLLSVDKDGNVFINPNTPQSPPSLLRTIKHELKDTLKFGYVYNHYQNKWYINRRNH